MASGVASGPWGITPRQVAKMNEYSDSFTNQLSLSSIPGTFDKFGNYISPLTIANKPFYNKFGNNCTKFKSNECENPATGRPIKKYGKVYNNLVEQCKMMFENNTSSSKSNIFIGSKPKLPRDNERMINYGNQNVKHNYQGEPKYVSINSKKYSIGDTAKIFPDGRTGNIIKIGPNNIILSKSDNKERRLTLEQFVKLNSNGNARIKEKIFAGAGMVTGMKKIKANKNNE